MRGFFLVVEGMEASGKTTLVSGLSEHLKNLGYPVVLTREPGGTPVGEAVRSILSDPENDMHPWSEFFLFLAARAENTRKLILPALRERKLVISDRFYHSSFAYQGAARGLPVKVLRRVNKLATGGLVPDLTIIADAPVDVALKRLSGSRDRIEREDPEFHRKVRQAYLDMAKKSGRRIKIVETTGPPEESLEIALDMVLERLKTKRRNLK